MPHLVVRYLLHPALEDADAWDILEKLMELDLYPPELVEGDGAIAKVAGVLDAVARESDPSVGESELKVA